MYCGPGTYTVTLTVGDGTDTSTITKPAYIDVHNRTYLPLVLRNYDPLLYDDFNDATWDGAWNPALWRRSDSDSTVSFYQRDGALVITNVASANPSGTSLIATSALSPVVPGAACRGAPQDEQRSQRWMVSLGDRFVCG